MKSQKKTRKPKRPVEVTYSETKRQKMERWVKSGTHGARLVQLGVPLRMLTTHQLNQFLDYLPVMMETAQCVVDRWRLNRVRIP
jgi:hypothetical protein